ncbi:MAG: LolA family protein [Phycisphaerae bacterium]
MKLLGIYQRIKNSPDGPAPRRADRIRTDVVVLRTFLTALACLTITTLCAGAGTRLNARTELVKMLAAMGKLNSIQCPFVCEKQLQILRKPFFSHGIITIARPRQVRFETIWPYRSCYILNGQSIYMRNESDSHWHTGTVNSQPAIGIIMRQFAAWSLGSTGKVIRKYQVSVRRATRPVPQDAPAGSASINHKPTRSTFEIFTLRPLGGVLKEAIDEIQLGFATSAGQGAARRQAAAKPLKYIRIVAKNGDQSIFWLRRTQLNPQLKSQCFAPVGPP